MNLDLSQYSEFAVQEDDGAICRYIKDGDAWLIRGTEPEGEEKDLDIISNNDMIELVASLKEGTALLRRPSPRPSRLATTRTRRRKPARNRPNQPA